MKLTECFKIRIYRCDKLSFQDIKLSEILYNIELPKRELEYNPIQIVADPFLFSKNETLFLFYEIKRRWGEGKIAMVSTKDLIKWTSPIIVLEESFHLSYPFVFEDNNHIYMIPEASEAHGIRLYEAVDGSLTKFVYKKDILSRTSPNKNIWADYCDSSVIKLNDVYYLHTTICYGGINTLELYTSDNLYGHFKPHPCSPIVMSKKYGRNGGSLLCVDGELYRIAQDCEQRYGDNVHVFKVDVMSPSLYIEHLIKNSVFDKSDTYYKDGGHHINVAEFKRNIIIATDAKEYRLLLYATLLRIVFLKLISLCCFFKRMMLCRTQKKLKK